MVFNGGETNGGAKRRVAVATLGCKLNHTDTESMLEAFRECGWEQVAFDGEADVYVVNTCTVTGSTDNQGRQLLRRAIREKERRPGVRVAATGCYAQAASEALAAALPELDLIVGNVEKEKLVEWIGEAAPANAPKLLVGDIDAEREIRDRPRPRRSAHTRAFLRIQDGCGARCAYCIVPSVRGPSRSETPANALAAARRFVGAGHLEIVLAGIHIGSYGKDLEPRSDLPSLLHDLAGAVPGCRIRLSSLDPGEFTPRLLETIEALPDVCRHFHVSLQSGCDDVLRRMKRPYRAEAARAAIQSLADRFPDASIGADVIVGFPGETAEEFEETARFLETAPLAYMHVFRYSSRPGTPAADMPHPVKESDKKARAARLAAMRAGKLAAFRARFIGRELDVLVERRAKRSALLEGTSDNYLRTLLPGGDDLIGKRVRVRALRATADAVEGEIAVDSGLFGVRRPQCTDRTHGLQVFGHIGCTFS